MLQNKHELEKQNHLLVQVVEYHPLERSSGVDYTDEIRSRRSRSYNNVKTKQVSRAVRTSRVGQAYQAQRVELENIVDRTNPVIKKVVKVFNSTLNTVSNFIVPKAQAQVVAKTVGSGTGGGGG